MIKYGYTFTKQDNIDDTLFNDDVKYKKDKLNKSKRSNNKKPKDTDNAINSVSNIDSDFVDNAEKE